VEKLIEPVQYASGYQLDLYCDHDNGRHPFNAFPSTYLGETFAECAAHARADGWAIHYRTRTATCPLCTVMRKRLASGQSTR
jgi:hypothetical protein